MEITKLPKFPSEIFVQMISTLPMKQVYFILPRWMVSQATNETLSGVKKAMDCVTVLSWSNMS
jgi:hypothetical protein